MGKGDSGPLDYDNPRAAHVPCAARNCDGEVEPNVTLTDFMVVDTTTLWACTPRCLFEAFRDWLEESDYGCRENPDLLPIVALDVFSLLERYMELVAEADDWAPLDDREGERLRWAWLRLGAVLGQVALTPEHPADPF